MIEIEREWYVDELRRLKQQFKDTDSRHSKLKIDILQQMMIIEDILRKNEKTSGSVRE